MSAVGLTHTEGPWEYDAESMQVIAPKCGYQGTSTPVICEVASLEYGESHKNGLLLGAATDMLAALEEIALIRHALQFDPLNTETSVRCAAAWARIHAAIAKATGSAS